MPSSISAARAALYAKLQAHASLGAGGLQVVYGPPDAYEEQEVISLLGTVDTDEEAITLGPGNKDETYDILVGIKAHNPAGTAAEVDARGYAIADAVAGAVEADQNYTLNGTVLWAFAGGPRTPNRLGVLPAKGGGWVLFLEVPIRCKARVVR